MPNSILEALQFELPVILSNIEPHKEIVNLGNLGIIFKNNNERDLKFKIDEIIKNTLLNEEVKKIKNKISAKRMNEEYMKIYKKIKGVDNE